MLFGVSRDLVFFVFFTFVRTKEWVWKFDSDIGNPLNWVGGKLAEGCNGVHFAPVNPAPVVIQGLRTREVTLPRDGEVVIASDGFIEFRDNRKCIKLKPIDYHRWYDPDSWIQTDSNVAIPDKEKVPCIYDDVILPKVEHFRMAGPMNPVVVRTVKMENKQVSSLDLIAHYVENQLYSHSSFLFLIVIDPDKSCINPYGCLCHDFDISLSCPVKDNQKLKCKDPISPEGFCDDICGAYVIFKPGEGPNLNQLKTKLKEYSVDTHVSRVVNYLGQEVMQVVFSEKDYTGRSVEDAQDFQQFLQEAHVSPQMYKSGEFLAEGGTSSLAIVFGSLAAVLIFFAVLLYLNANPATITIFMSRFQRARGSVFNVPFFARFDNTDENLIIDGQSESGSILDLPKSFDNPIYGQTTSQSTATSEHENPLYEVAKDVDAEE